MKNTKILALFVLLLTVTLALCACDLFNSGNEGNETETITKTYEYAFNIGENSIKYVTVLTKEGSNSPKSEFQIYLNDVKTSLSEPFYGFANNDMTTFDIDGLNFTLSDDGKMVYAGGSSPRLINPYDAFAGEYRFNGDENYVITLTKDGKASASVDSEIVLDYYPIDFDRIAVVKNENGYVYRIQSDNTIWQEEGVAAGVTAENLAAYYNMVFSTESYLGEGYFYDARLYINGEKCVIVGPFFIVLDYTEKDSVLTTAQGNFKITENRFDFVVVKELKSDTGVLKIYENGMAYLNNTEYDGTGLSSGRYEAVDTEGFDDIGGAIYDYGWRRTFVFDTKLNCIYSVEGDKVIYPYSYKKYTSYYDIEYGFTEDLTKGYVAYGDTATGIKYYIPIIIRNKLCDNLILAEDGNIYALSDDGKIGVGIVSNLGDIDMFLSPDSCTMKTLDYTNDGGYFFEDRVYFVIEKDDDVYYLEWSVEGDYFSVIELYDVTKIGDIITNGAFFIKEDGAEMKSLSLNKYETLVTDGAAINDYGNGYITVSQDSRHYFVNKETLTFDFCIEDENFAQNVENIDFGEHIINMQTCEIYATLYDEVYNSSVPIYVPIALEEVPLFDGLYRYQTDSYLYHYVFIWDASPDYYYYDTNWNYWEVNETLEPDSVENFRNVRNNPDDIAIGNNNVHISICHYGDTVKMYIAAFHYPEDGSESDLYFYDTVIEGEYSYDEATDTITVTATHYVYTISTVVVDVDYQYKTFTRTAVAAE